MFEEKDLKKALFFYFGHKEFRDPQEKIISTILKKQNIIGILPTGIGKSLCFQLPGIFFKNITLVISPLISLIENQINILNKKNIFSIALTSNLTKKQLNESIEKIKLGKIKFIYLSPEKLFSGDILNIIKNILVDHIVIDEAHCISQWGHDFRPKYKKIGEIINKLNKNIVVSAFTATANKRVLYDIIKYLKLINVKVFKMSFDRPNLFIDIKFYEKKNNWIYNFIFNKHKKNIGLIYCSTRTIAERVGKYLIEKNILAGIYHAGLTRKNRKEIQDNFFLEKYNVLVATNAFGMGIDKKNIRFIIHYNMPNNIESYYQEIGRAGRDGLNSECIILFSKQDVFIQEFLSKQRVYYKYRIQEKQKIIEEMKKFIFTKNCYKQFLLNYFGEKKKPCNNCGNCKAHYKKINYTTECKKIFSCIYYLKNKHTEKILIDVLKGKKTKKIIADKLFKLSVYGILKEIKDNEIKFLIQELEIENYIGFRNKYYPFLKKKAIFFLKNKSNDIFLKKKDRIKF